MTFLACQTPERQQQENESGNPEISGSEVKNIIVYGSKTCPHCMVFIRELDEADISYTFKEVDNDDANFKEMYDKIKSINFQGYVNYPVLDVGGEILVAPEFDHFYKIYRQPQSDG
jgi:glutaredoxin